MRSRRLIEDKSEGKILGLIGITESKINTPIYRVHEQERKESIMGYTVGMPVMKLDRCNHFGKKNEHSGNAKAVTCEALEERYSSDADLDREMTAENVYYGFTSGEALTAHWEQMADAYRVIDKNGKEKKLRSDAGIGFAGICKPEMDFMDSLEDEEIEKFMEDSSEVILGIYEKRGCVIDSIVLHYDEGNPHLHYFGHDPEYKLGRKLGLKLYTALNDTEYPKQMRQRGWDIDPLTDYQEATKDMTEDEIAEYKKRRKADRKKKHGLSSTEYKAHKKSNDIISEANVSARMIKKKAELEAQLEKSKTLAELEKQKMQLEAQEATLQDKLMEITEREEKSLKLASEAFEMYEKAQSFYLKELNWMNIQQKEYIRKRNAEAERQKHKSRPVPTEFTDIETAHEQQETDMDYN